MIDPCRPPAKVRKDSHGPILHSEGRLGYGGAELKLSDWSGGFSFLGLQSLDY